MKKDQQKLNNVVKKFQKIYNIVKRSSSSSTGFEYLCWKSFKNNRNIPKRKWHHIYYSLVRYQIEIVIREGIILKNIFDGIIQRSYFWLNILSLSLRDKKNLMTK